MFLSIRSFSLSGHDIRCEMQFLWIPQLERRGTTLNMHMNIVQETFISRAWKGRVLFQHELIYSYIMLMPATIFANTP